MYFERCQQNCVFFIHISQECFDPFMYTFIMVINIIRATSIEDN